jgi:hypothetical protein
MQKTSDYTPPGHFVAGNQARLGFAGTKRLIFCVDECKNHSDDLNFKDFLSIIYEEPREVPYPGKSSRWLV